MHGYCQGCGEHRTLYQRGGRRLCASCAGNKPSFSRSLLKGKSKLPKLSDMNADELDIAQKAEMNFEMGRAAGKISRRYEEERRRRR